MITQALFFLFRLFSISIIFSTVTWIFGIAYFYFCEEWQEIFMGIALIADCFHSMVIITYLIIQILKNGIYSCIPGTQLNNHIESSFWWILEFSLQVFYWGLLCVYFCMYVHQRDWDRSFFFYCCCHLFCIETESHSVVLVLARLELAM